MARQERPQRIAFVIGSAGRGGTESRAQLLVRELRVRGNHVSVFVLEGGHDPVQTFGAEVRVLGPERRQTLTGLFLYGAALIRLRRQLSDGSFDVIHAALARAYVAAPFAAPWRHRPRVVAWRGSIRSDAGGAGWFRHLERIASKRTDVVIANSKSVAHYCIHSGGIPPDRIRIVQNALDSWRFEPTLPAAKSVGVFRLVALGNLRPVKGHRVLIDAAAIVAAHRRVEVVIIGTGAEREGLIQYADRVGVKLRLPGFIADTRPMLRSADVFVHPSHSEGASNAIAEAMAAGCAVVATDVGGAEEMLGSTGRLVRPSDPGAMAEAVADLIENAPAAIALGKAARSRARSLFSMEEFVNAHLQIYAGE